MPIYLDSALIAEAEIAARLGWIAGITTNPALLAQSSLPPEETLPRLAQLSPGPVFYQLVSETVIGMIKEAEQAHHLVGSQLVLKIPPTAVGFEACARLARDIPCCVTAIYHPAQALVAQAAGADFAVVYFHRAMTLLDDGMKLVREMVAVCAGSRTKILAASLKSPDEVVVARLAGIEYFTLPLVVLQAMVTCELSEQTMADFNRKGRGLA